jgi:ABC-type uncharacterized transport system permease subunit
VVVVVVVIAVAVAAAAVVVAVVIVTYKPSGVVNTMKSRILRRRQGIDTTIVAEAYYKREKKTKR